MTVNIKYEDIDFNKLKVKVNNIFSYNDKPLYFQTSFHNLNNFEFPLNNEYCKSISSRLKLKIDMSSNIDMYKFYKNLDDFLDNDEFRKQHFNDIIVKYRPIINKNYDIIYNFPCKKMRNMVPFDFPSDYYFDNDNDSILMKLQIISQDKYYDYIFDFRLLETINDTKTQIKFESLDELMNFIKKGTNIRFIIKPRLVYDLESSLYFVQLYAIMIEINENKIINYDYDNIIERIQYRNEILAIRYQPENINELVKDGIITTTHLYIN